MWKRSHFPATLIRFTKKKYKTLVQRIALLVNEVAPAGSHQLMQQALQLRTEYLELAIIVVN
jgi:hypothetical protein